MNSKKLINELVEGYTYSKYDEKYLKEKITLVLEFVLPKIAVIVKSKNEKELFKLWNAVKAEEEIKSLFRKTLESTDRPIVIYVASKFENNQYFGTRIIDEALKWK